jgi:hypothetical protein
MRGEYEASAFQSDGEGGQTGAPSRPACEHTPQGGRRLAGSASKPRRRPIGSALPVGVKEVTQTVATPREQCADVQVQRQAPVKDGRVDATPPAPG